MGLVKESSMGLSQSIPGARSWANPQAHPSQLTAFSAATYRTFLLLSSAIMASINTRG